MLKSVQVYPMIDYEQHIKGVIASSGFKGAFLKRSRPAPKSPADH